MTRWWCAAGTWRHDDPPEGYDVYVVKTATLEPRVNPCELVLRPLPDQGYLNRIGVRNPGFAAVLDYPPEVPGQRVLSVLGFGAYEWGSLASMADGRASHLELNLSCPNTEAEPVGEEALVTGQAVEAARSFFSGVLGAKLPPTASQDVIVACEAEGADYLCLSNTLGTSRGGLSGRPLRALTLDCIERASLVTSLPIVGGGGIIHRVDGQAYLDVGAAELFQGTANLLAGHIPEAARE